MSLLNANIITGNHIHVILTCVSLLRFSVSAHILWPVCCMYSLFEFDE